jgi:glycosyltransferase involved in cell wall biosynthesis
LHNAPPAAGWRAVGANWLGRLAAKADHVLVVSPDLEGWIERLGATAVERAIVPVRSLAPPDSGRAATRRELGVSEFPGSRAPAVPSEDAGPGDRAATSPNAEPADQVATNPAADLGDPFATGQAARPQDPAGTSPNAGPGRPLLVTVARLAHQKGLDILIEAAARLGRRDPAPLWLVAGAGPDRAKLEALIAETGAPVKLLGPRDDVAALYQAADLVVGTSRWEGQPIALREAMTLGAAVVATDVGGTKAALAGGALLTQADAGALADGVGQLLDNPEELRELRRRGAAAARRFPGQAEMLAQALRLYGQRPPAGARNSPRSPRPERNRRRF